MSFFNIRRDIRSISMNQKHQNTDHVTTPRKQLLENRFTSKYIGIIHATGNHQKRGKRIQHITCDTAHPKEI